MDISNAEPNSTQNVLSFELVLRKTAHGFGIVFTKHINSANILVVDGFIDPEGDLEVAGQIEKLRDQLQVGDILVGVNSAQCSEMTVGDVVSLLRAAPVGENVLQFERITQDDAKASSIKGLMGALMKVKSRIKGEIEGEEEFIQEQREQERFEQEWLSEFDRLKEEHKTKWETCTYMADDFCGLLYHSSDEQQQSYLVREYPLLMEAWRDADLSGNAFRVRPDWPAAKITYTLPVTYCAQPLQLAPSIKDHENIDNVLPFAQTQPIQSSPSLLIVLEQLRTQFMWSKQAIDVFNNRLESAGIYSCHDFIDALDVRNGAYFEREFQSKDYPRLTKSIYKVLYEQAHRVDQQENNQDLCMESLIVNQG